MKISAFAMPVLLCAVAGGAAALGGQSPEPVPGGERGPQMAVQVLDQPGPVTLDPYLAKVVKDVRAHWHPPSVSSEDEVDIRITIKPDGSLEAMHLDRHPENDAVNKAAWGAITETTFAPLPWGLRTPMLHLRLRFFAA